MRQAVRMLFNLVHDNIETAAIFKLLERNY